MTLRPARSTDANALVELLVERHPEMRMSDVVSIDQALARKTFAQAAFKHGHTNEGATFLMVAEGEGGAIDAFMFGVLSRFYVFGDKLWAQDVLLVGRKGSDPHAASALIDAYVDWASSNPRVVEIQVSHSDLIPGGALVGRIYRRKGFVPCATGYRLVRADPLLEAVTHHDTIGDSDGDDAA